jgi:hypothetical protein
MSDKNALLVEEQALHEQELALVEMEAQLHNQEQGIAQMEKAFLKKNRAIFNLSSYVADQEASLLARAKAMGPKALKLVHELLAAADGQSGEAALELGCVAERQEALHRRRDLLAQRNALVEEREALYASRVESLERAESHVSELEQKLVRRETAVSEAARAVFSASSNVLEDDDEEGDPDVYETLSQLSGRASVGVPTGRTSDSKPLVRTSENDSGSSLRRVRTTQTRARVRTNQFKITLEAQLDGADPHHFFRYEADGPDDLPGFFIATPNLLKEGREVRVRITGSDKHIEVAGIVAWRRQRGQPGGGPGMGVELIGLSADEVGVVKTWVTEREPVVI